MLCCTSVGEVSVAGAKLWECPACCFRPNWPERWWYELPTESPANHPWRSRKCCSSCPSQRTHRELQPVVTATMDQLRRLNTIIWAFLKYSWKSELQNVFKARKWWIQKRNFIFLFNLQYIVYIFSFNSHFWSPPSRYWTVNLTN